MALPQTLPAADISYRKSGWAAAWDVAKLFDLLTHAAQAQLGVVPESRSTLGTAFYLGDGLQRTLTDGIFDLLQPQSWRPASVWQFSTEALQQALQFLTLADPRQVSLAYQELRNKIEVFELVQNLSSRLGLVPGQFLPLPDLVKKAYSLSPFAALWAVEGTGHYYTNAYWQTKGVPSGLLLEANAPVPESSLLMLHAGMGLAFADRVLRPLLPDAPSQRDTRDAVQEFISLCRNNSRPGYLRAAIESVGLVTRDFYPDLLDIIHQEFRKLAPDMIGFFWHGVGRALYFSRKYFLPLLTTVWNGVGREVRRCADQRSAMAGLAWAMALVNMRQPAILQNVLRSQTDASQLAGLTNGVVSAVMMRQATTYDEPFVRAFYLYQPQQGRMETQWRDHIADPTKRGLNVFFPILRRLLALDMIFRYEDLEKLVRSLEERSGFKPAPSVIPGQETMEAMQTETGLVR